MTRRTDGVVGFGRPSGGATQLRGGGGIDVALATFAHAAGAAISFILVPEECRDAVDGTLERADIRSRLTSARSLLGLAIDNDFTSRGPGR